MTSPALRERWREAAGRGVQKGLRSSWELVKVIAPVSIGVTALSHTPALSWLSRTFAPVMGWLGLSGEAAVVLVAGNAVGLYSAIGAMMSLDLSPQELLIVALMLSFSHNLLVETAVTKRLGVSYWGVMAYRVGLAIVAALLLNGLFTWLPIGGAAGGAAPDGLHAAVAAPEAVAAGAERAVAGGGSEPAKAWVARAGEWVGAVLTDAAGGLIKTVALLIAIIIPLMVSIEVLKEAGILESLSRRIQPYMGWLGMSGQAGFPLLAGFVFGLAYGAGVILEAARDNGLSQGDRRLLCVFLVACHAAIEDTLLFVPLGVNPFLLLGTRLALALVLTAVAARIGVGERLEEVQG